MTKRWKPTLSSGRNQKESGESDCERRRGSALSSWDSSKKKCRDWKWRRRKKKLVKKIRKNMLGKISLTRLQINKIKIAANSKTKTFIWVQGSQRCPWGETLGDAPSARPTSRESNSSVLLLNWLWRYETDEKEHAPQYFSLKHDFRSSLVEN